MNYYLLLPFLLVCIIAICIWIGEERITKKIKSKNNGLLLDGREVATILINSTNLKIVLDQTKKNAPEYYEESKSKLYLPDQVINKTTLYAMLITIKEISSIYLMKDTYHLKSFLESLCVILSTIGFILLIFSLVIQNELIYIVTIILLYLCIFLSLILNVIFHRVKKNTLKLIEKYNMVEADNELKLIKTYLRYYIFMPITFATLPMIEIFKYIKESF